MSAMVLPAADEGFHPTTSPVLHDEGQTNPRTSNATKNMNLGVEYIILLVDALWHSTKLTRMHNKSSSGMLRIGASWSSDGPQLRAAEKGARNRGMGEDDIRSSE